MLQNVLAVLFHNHTRPIEGVWFEPPVHPPHWAPIMINVIISDLLCTSGNPNRYQSRGVIRMNRNDSKPFEDQRLGVPGTGTESEADQHLRGMVKNQLDTNVTLER